MTREHVFAKPMQRADLAKRTGCNLETIRYYEKIGVMPDPPRSANGYRAYDENHVSRLRFILRTRQLGFSIGDIRALLLHVDDGTQTCAAVKHSLQVQLATVREKIRDLQRMEAVLAASEAQCSGEDVPQCPVLESLAS